MGPGQERNPSCSRVPSCPVTWRWRNGADRPGAQPLGRGPAVKTCSFPFFDPVVPGPSVVQPPRRQTPRSAATSELPPRGFRPVREVRGFRFSPHVDGLEQPRSGSSAMSCNTRPHIQRVVAAACGLRSRMDVGDFGATPLLLPVHRAEARVGRHHHRLFKREFGMARVPVYVIRTRYGVFYTVWRFWRFSVSANLSPLNND